MTTIALFSRPVPREKTLSTVLTTTLPPAAKRQSGRPSGPIRVLRSTRNTCPDPRFFRTSSTRPPKIFFTRWRASPPLPQGPSPPGIRRLTGREKKAHDDGQGHPQFFLPIPCSIHDHLHARTLPSGKFPMPFRRYRPARGRRYPGNRGPDPGWPRCRGCCRRAACSRCRGGTRPG